MNQETIRGLFMVNTTLYIIYLLLDVFYFFYGLCETTLTVAFYTFTLIDTNKIIILPKYFFTSNQMI